MAQKLVFHVVKKDSETGLVDNVEFVRFEESNICYVFPAEVQNIENHTELLKRKTITNLRESMIRAGQFRNIKLKLNNELKSEYMDEDENFVFIDKVLEEKPLHVLEEEQNSESTSREETTVKSLRDIEKDFITPKFDRRTQKALDWINDFETECTEGQNVK